MALYRVEAQELVVKMFEAETEEEACKMMDEYLQNCGHGYFDWGIDAYEMQTAAEEEEEGVE